MAERQAELERAELDRKLTEEVVDITLPGEARPRGHLHLITRDPARGRGHLPRARLPGRRRPRGRDDPLQLRRPQLPGRPPGPLAAPVGLPRRRRALPHGDLALADPGDGVAAAADLHGLARPRLPARHARRDAHADLPPGRGPGHRPRHHHGRPQGHAAAHDARALRRGARAPLPHARLPLHGAVARARRELLPLRGQGVPGLPLLRLDRDRRLGHGRSRPCSSSSASTPRSGRASPSAWASSASPCSGTACRRSACSGRTTSACSRQF